MAELIEALRCLPGVGLKSAQRMAFHLLEHDRHGARKLADVLERAMRDIGNCQYCRTFSETPVCELCASNTRDTHTLCVVESPADLVAIEAATDYRGRYFVLLGRLSPLDGMGPDELGLDLLTRRLADEDIHELIIATNSTVEGQATAQYLHQLADAGGIKATHLAYGVPLGGELEYVDQSTLAHAFGQRQIL